MKITLIYGLGKSGLAVIEMLKDSENLAIYDDNKSLLNEVALKYNIEVFSGFENIKKLSNIDKVIVSPSVSVFDKNILLLKEHNIRLMSECEFAFENEIIPLISVTGSNGKTTTCKLIEHIFNYAEKNALAVGNIGTPLSACKSYLSENILINEISSFQLALSDKFHSKINCFLNITPNHLDWHREFIHYLECKKKLFDNSSKNDVNILSLDDKYLSKWNKDTNLIYFSLHKKCTGAYKRFNRLYLNLGKKEFLCKVSDLKLKGKHNIQNVLCSSICARLTDIPTNTIKKALQSFEPIKHRISFVGKFKNISFYNDSKSTSPDACLNAIKSIKGHIVLLMGGKDKNIDYKNLFRQFRTKISYVIFYGENREKLKSQYQNVSNKNNFYIEKNLKDAFNKGINLKLKKYNLLLSPATSSFDEFASYEERGEYFENLCLELKKSLEKTN